jgi:tRNA(Ile)-lysidine synthase TilS/MesJ
VFVQNLAAKYKLPFVYDEGRLGANASEATARDARYAFLRRVKEISGALAIATAHHEDDVFETAILNLLRGTGRKGLSSLRSTEEIYRPLLTTPKANIIAYARANGLNWREDSTNANPNYLRNYVRRRLLSRFDEPSLRRLRALIDAAALTNAELDGLLVQQLKLQPAHDEIDRQWFISLPHAVAREIIAVWLREHGVNGFDKKSIERIVTLGKTLAPGKRIDVDSTFIIVVNPGILALRVRDR